ncbi:MAG TPA: outer membrane protein assembly factor BamA, partial [Rhodospirillaceae bacterium]|nr:outer membrane protein assembly factor BamA [Rhodospirillaceae bacterium]
MTMISQQKLCARLKSSVFSSGLFLVLSVLILGLLPACPALGQEVAESLLSVPAYQEPQGEEVREILIEGTQRIDDAAVVSYLTFGVGDMATSDKVKASLKELFATGLFVDINLAVQDGVLTVQVVENPIISSVSFEGMDMINQDDLEKEVQLKPRLVYTLPKVQKDVQRILDLYRRSGHFAATVDPQVVTLDQNRVDVVFKIVEGKHTGVRRIQFIGNNHFDDDILRGQIHTQESAWWKFFSSSDFYDPDRVSYDRELLRRFYLDQGYVDFRIVSSVAEMAPDKEDFFLTFTLEEGNRYKFGKISVESEIKGLEGQDLQPELLTLFDTWYNGGKIENTVAKLTAILGDRQYAFVNIVPETEKDKEQKIVDLTYRIKPGERVHIGRIDITGNTRTIDKVIRREILVAEGDPYSISKIKQSEQRIKDLGYFETVKITPAQGVQTDRSDVKVEVKEKATGDISLGAGFSSTDGVLGDFSIRERNFLGKGQDVRFGAMLSGNTKQLDFSFTEPYFLDRDLSAGIDLFHVRTDQQEESNYDEVTTGFSLRLGYPLSEALRQVVSYTLRRDKISDVSFTASRFVRDQEGESTSSFVSQELVYDKRNSRLEPTEG